VHKSIYVKVNPAFSLSANIIADNW